MAVIGLGYVGLPTALGLAEKGCRVFGCDLSEERIAAIKRGTVDLLDADRARLQRVHGSERFALTTNVATSADADAVVVCVPTPVDEHLVPDLAPLALACQAAVDHAVAGQTIVVTSTTYIGCTRDLLVEPLAGRGLRAGEEVFVAFSPERIDPGHPEHIQQDVPRVVGGVTSECARRAARLVALSASAVHTVSSPEVAEASKLLENTFRAVNIAFANEFADTCSELGVDPIEVIGAAATKPYGFLPFRPGSGVGGHCIPCDPHYLLWQMRARRVALPLTESAMSANATRPRRVVARARDVLSESGRTPGGARVVIVGVSYKPDVSDLRGSPALEIMSGLRALGADVSFADPLVEYLHLDGNEFDGVPDPENHDWDLVVLHTMHTGADYRWVEQCPRVLDAAYRSIHPPTWTRL